MQNPKRVAFVRNVLILAALVGTVLFSWLLGHILRFSIPALWHPPLQEPDPRIKIGAEFDSVDLPSYTTLPGRAPVEIKEQAGSNEGCGWQPEAYTGYTFYTSFPAKCRTVN